MQGWEGGEGLGGEDGERCSRQGSSRSKGGEAGKPSSLAGRKFVGGFLEGSLLGPDHDPDTRQTSPGWLQLTSPHKLLWGPPRHALEDPLRRAGRDRGCFWWHGFWRGGGGEMAWLG